MNNKVRIEVDESLKVVLEEVKRKAEEEFKRKYKIDEIEIYGNIASKILAAKYNSHKEIEFEIHNLGNRRGILKVV